MTDWKDDLPSCFGAADKRFALHQSDKLAARALRKRLVAEDVTYRDLEDAVVGYLYRKGCTREHLDSEVKAVSKMFDGKLR